MNRQEPKGIKRYWHSFRGLPRPHRRILVRACIMLPLCTFLLRRLGFCRVLDLLGRLAWRPTGKQVVCKARQYPTDFARANDVALMVATAANHGFLRTTCLHRSLVLHALLLREGVPNDLRMGARRGETSLEAHAWVEIEGTVIGEVDGVDRRFTPMERSLHRP